MTNETYRETETSVRGYKLRMADSWTLLDFSFRTCLYLHELTPNYRSSTCSSRVFIFHVLLNNER